VNWYSPSLLPSPFRGCVAIKKILSEKERESGKRFRPALRLSGEAELVTFNRLFRRPKGMNTFDLYKRRFPIL
jgi:hypothetical protein